MLTDHVDRHRDGLGNGEVGVDGLAHHLFAVVAPLEVLEHQGVPDAAGVHPLHDVVHQAVAPPPGQLRRGLAPLGFAGQGQAAALLDRLGRVQQDLPVVGQDPGW